MKRILLALIALAIAIPAQAQDKLVVSIWGGSWRDLVRDTVAKKFTQETGVPAEFITGGTIDRLNKSRLGWLYVDSGLFEKLDFSKIPNAGNLVDEARFSPYHLGSWAYVYTIGYRTDLIKNIKFDTWNDLWNPELRNKIAAPDFDPSSLVVVAAILSGGDARNWQAGEAKLKALKPNFRAYYTDDANSQQLLASGETPVQDVLSMNAYYMIGQGIPITLSIPKEGGVLGVDAVAIMSGSKHVDLDHKFINVLYDPGVQAEIADQKKGSPVEAANRRRSKAARREASRMAQMVC